ncbi:MAG: winged helix-turn-helix domain-containing protein [Pyrinomonadaceae bacterium]
MQRFYDFGSFRIDATKRLLLRDDQVVPLKPKAFETLLLLVQNSDRVMEKDELMKALWPNSFVEEANLTQHISLLRKALGESPTEHRYIVTAPGRGYRFVADVREPGDNGGEHEPKASTFPSPPKEETETGVPGTAQQDFRQQPLKISGAVKRDTRWWPSRTLLAVSLIILTVALSYTWIAGRLKEPEASTTVRSIAVLPFKTLGVEAGEEYLGLGISDALINRLGNIRQVVVRPTNAVRKYTDPGQDPLVAGRELGVDAVLDGNIQRSGDHVRVTVLLISVSTGATLWSETFDEKYTNIFTVQDRVSEQASRALTLELTGEEKRLLTKRHTNNAEAYQAYLKGRFFWNKRSEEGYTKAIEHFEQAIEQDHDYGQAYAGLADAYALLGSMGNTVLPRREAMPRAKAAALKALEIDDTLAEAHTSLAFVRMHYEWDWLAAEREFKRAIEINPNYVTAHHWYAYYLAAMERMDEAIAEIKRAQEIDPLSLIISTDVAEMFYYARQYDRAIEQSQKTLEMDANFALAHRGLGWAYLQKGMHKEATASFQRAVSISGGRIDTIASLGYAYATSGRQSEALTILSELKERAGRNYVAPHEIAIIYASLNEKDQALAWLEKAYEERSGSLILIKVEPSLDPLRSDPRFADLVRRVGTAR